jgi:hypothetical protein
VKKLKVLKKLEENGKVSIDGLNISPSDIKQIED